MRVLLDMSVSPSLADLLREHGPEAEHAYRIGFGRATDQQSLDRARSLGEIIITADLDFPRLLALSSADGPGIILFRGGNYSDAEMRELLLRVLEKVPAETIEKSVCVVDQLRVRVTRLPLGGDPAGIGS